LLLKAVKDGVEGASKKLDDLIAAKMPIERDEFEELFNSGKLDINNKISWTKRGERLIDGGDKNGITVDTIKGLAPLGKTANNPFNLRRLADQAYTGGRGKILDKWVYEGHVLKPKIERAGADLIDPVNAIAKGFNQVAKNFHYREAKKFAADSFVEEFYSVLDNAGGDVREMRKNPADAFYNPQWKENADSEILSQAQSVHAAMHRFFGRNTKLGDKYEHYVQKITDAIFERKGATVKARNLPRVTDPATFLRSIAFHSKLGLFNPVQYILQSQSMAVSMAISGSLKEAWAAMMATHAFQYMRWNKQAPKWISEHKNLSLFGWDKETFLESWNELNKTGWMEIGGSSSWLDDVLEPKFFVSGRRKILDKGRIFFDGGERNNRLAAWNVAFLEFKRLNPGVKKLTSRHRNQILVRADDLSGNMTRQSAANWQKGVLTVPTQFSAYFLRLFELYAGNRLTWPEKRRLLVTHSLMYGVGVGGAGAFALPYAVGATVTNEATGIGLNNSSGNIYDDMKVYFDKQGIDVDNGAADVIFNGAVGGIMEALTGSDTNANVRYGPGGFVLLEELAQGTLDPLDLAFGPGGSIFTDFARGAMPLAVELANVGNTAYVKDVASAARVVMQNVSTVNNAWNSYMAFRYGTLKSRESQKEQLDDLTPAEAGLLFIGVRPRRSDDTWRFFEDTSSFNKMKRAGYKDASTHLRKWINAANDDERQKYWDQATMALHLTGWQPQEIPRQVSRFINEERETLATMAKKKFIKQNPESSTATKELGN
jgi:hypothetical protein